MLSRVEDGKIGRGRNTEKVNKTKNPSKASSVNY